MAELISCEGDMRHLIRVFLTSRDAEKIASLLREVEQTSQPGDSNLAAEIHTPQALIQFCMDQDRAHRGGLTP